MRPSHGQDCPSRISSPITRLARRRWLPHPLSHHCSLKLLLLLPVSLSVYPNRCDGVLGRLVCRPAGQKSLHGPLDLLPSPLFTSIAGVERDVDPHQKTASCLAVEWCPSPPTTINNINIRNDTLMPLLISWTILTLCSALVPNQTNGIFCTDSSPSITSCHAFEIH